MSEFLNYTTFNDPLGATRTEALGINDAGDIVGYYAGTDHVQHGFLFSDGTFTTIDTLFAEAQSAWDINNAGQIVGGYAGIDGKAHGYVYSGGNFTILDDPLGPNGTFAMGNNNVDQIVGWFDDGTTFNNNAGHAYKGFIYSGGSYTTLAHPLGLQTFAYDINDAGQVVGSYYGTDDRLHAFIYSNGDFTTIDPPGSGGATAATGINNNGQVLIEAAGHNYIYYNGNFSELNDDPSGVGRTYAVHINDSGLIVGSYYDGTNTLNGFLAVPTPPTVSVSGATSTLRAGQTDLITLTFSESVLGFDNADVSVFGGTLGTISQTDATHYTATFTPTGGVNNQTATIQVLASGTGTSAWTDVAGNAGTASNTLSITEDTLAPVPVITSEVLSKSGAVILTGTTGEANDTISVFDGTTLLGTTTTASDGTWSFTTGKASNAVHTYTATATDFVGNVGHSVNEAILGSSKTDTLVGTSDNDIIIGNGGNDRITGGGGADVLTGGNGKVTFIYNAAADSTPASHDTITDFMHGHDKFDFTNIAGIDTFQGNLTGSGNLTLNAHSVAYIEVTGNTVVLINTTNEAEVVTSSNVSAANVEIDLVGINLHLTNTDFLHV
jgi:probable HAF family extracellular repeat protein